MGTFPWQPVALMHDDGSIMAVIRPSTIAGLSSKQGNRPTLDTYALHFEKSPKTFMRFLGDSPDLLLNPKSFLGQLARFVHSLTVQIGKDYLLDDDVRHFCETAANIFKTHDHLVDAIKIYSLLGDDELLAKQISILASKGELAQAIDISYQLENEPLATMLHDEYCAGERSSFYSQDDWTTVSGTLWGSIESLVSEKVTDRIKKWGFEDELIPEYSLIHSAKNLVALEQEFDLFVPVAKAGLYLGAVASVLGLNVKAIEVHARNLANPTFRAVDELEEDDIKDKRVLILENDVKSGATLKATADILRKMGPKKLAAYLAAPTPPPETSLGGMSFYSLPDAVARLEAEGISIFHPRNMKQASVKPAYRRLHLEMQTVFGRLLILEKEIKKIVKSVRDQALCLAITQELKILRQMFYSFNPLIHETEIIRNYLLSQIEVSIRDYWATFQFDPELALKNLKRSSELWSKFPEFIGNELAAARYHPMTVRLGEKYRVPYQGRPHSYMAAFVLAQRAMLEEGFEVALIVGPEGFGYQPLFMDLGMPVVAVNIPEAEYDGRRSFKALGDLSVVHRKKVLVVEDDVRSGATLNKVWDEIKRFEPAEVGLYLGLNENFQKMDNIPSGYKKVFVTALESEADSMAFLKFLQTRKKILKTRAGRNPVVRQRLINAGFNLPQRAILTGFRKGQFK